MVRFCILLLFFGSVALAVVLYATHRPDLGRWFLLSLAAAWWLRLKFSV